MVTLFGGGTQAATVTTEHFLSSPNVAGKFSLQVDLVNMVANDVVELRVYKMVLTGGTARVVHFAQFVGVQPTEAMIAISEAIATTLTDATGLRFSLKQTFGTSRNFPWAVLNEEDFTDVSAIKAKTDNLPSDPADASVVAGLIAAVETKVDTVDGIVDSILVDTVEIGAAGAGLTNINLPNQTMDIVGNITGNLSGSVGSVTGFTAADVGAIKTRVELALPAAAADAAGGLPISDAGGLSLDDIANRTVDILERMYALVPISEIAVGATGNDTTHVHLDGLTFGDDEINNTLLVLYDASTDELHSRYITDWVASTELATVALLPFTPVNTDLYYLLTARQDLAVASVTGAVGSVTGFTPSDLTTILARLSPIATKTGTVVTDGGNSATSFKTDLTETPTDHFKDAFLRLTSGALINQVKKVTAYNGTTKAITVSGGFTATPADAVTFEIVND